MLTEHSRFTTIARHYNWLREQGHEHKQALSQLAENGDPEVLAILGKLDAVDQGAASRDTFLKQQIGELTRVVDASGNSQNSLVPGYIAAVSLKANLDETAARIRTSLTPKFAYMGLLCLSGLLISTLYGLYVYPQIKEMFDTFSKAIPGGAAGSVGVASYPLIFLLLSVITAGSYLLIVNSTYNLADGGKFAGPLHWFPGLSRLDLAIKRYLSVGIQHICARNGQSAEESKIWAHNYTNDANSDVHETLALAWNFDTIEQEFSYQFKAASEQIEAASKLSIRIFVATLTIIVLITIAAMIVNFYLPILNLAGLVA